MLRWDGRRLAVLDRTTSSGSQAWLELTGARDTAAAIARGAIGGQSLAGVAAAYAVAVEVSARPGLAEAGPEPEPRAADG